MKPIQAKTRVQRWLWLSLGVVSILTVFVSLPAQAFAQSNEPQAPRCNQEYAYLPHLVNRKYLRQTAPPLALTNKSNSPANLSESFTVTGTTTYTGSLTLTTGFEANVDVLFASVKSSFSVSVTGTISKSYSVTRTLSATVTVPAHSTRHILYGRDEIETTGEYELIRTNCSTVNEGTVTVFFPYTDDFVVTN